MTMRRILLLSNTIMHYRVKVYNDLAIILRDKGYEFYVASDSVQDEVNPVQFRYHAMNSLREWRKAIDDCKPSAVILFLHLKDGILFQVIRYCRKKGIKVVYWNHGINIADPHNALKNAVFHRIHSKCDALITYMPQMRRYFKKKNQKKLFIAPNTLSFSGIDRSKYKKNELRRRFGINEPFVVLFVARINRKRRLDVLVDGLQPYKNIALVIAGPGMTEDIFASIRDTEHYYYFGERYGEEINELFALSDVFCIPGSIGLAVNEAMFWALPPFMLDHGVHGPEREYVINGKNGYIASDEKTLIEKLVAISEDSKRLVAASEECLSTYRNEMSLDRMAEGFVKALDYCFGNK